MLRKIVIKKTFPLAFAILFLGIGYGIYMRSCGFGPIWPICMAATIFAGSMEFITVGLLLGTFNPLYTLLLTLIVNGRHLFYGISMLERYQNTGWKKFGLVSGLIDEAFSLNYITKLSLKSDRDWFMMLVTLLLYLSWVSGTAIGALFDFTSAAEIKGVNFVMTALFIVIFISQWQREKSHGASMLGVLAAALALPIFGKAYFMLPSIIVISFVFSIRWQIFKNKKMLV